MRLELPGNIMQKDKYNKWMKISGTFYRNLLKTLLVNKDNRLKK